LVRTQRVAQQNTAARRIAASKNIKHGGASAVAAAKILRRIFKPNIGAEKRCKSFAERLGCPSQKG
ncbi:hypothetical protein, partial [Campylobacter sp.]|uniref:hypothetical protein n=1 Tax=Campylobacter sp. TaxID=205 RepID=UPI002A836AF6